MFRLDLESAAATRQADLLRQAERHRLLRAARRAPRPGPDDSASPVATADPGGHLTALLARLTARFRRSPEPALHRDPAYVW